MGGNERGLPPVGQDVGVSVPVGLQPAADVADVGHPGPVPARSGQLLADPSFDRVPVEDGPVVCGAVGVELSSDTRSGRCRRSPSSALNAR